MALWRNIGGLNTIAPGATIHWGYYYPPGIHYTVRVKNLGAAPLTYNLNIGDWQ